MLPSSQPTGASSVARAHYQTGELQSPWCTHDKTMNHSAGNSGTWTNISHHPRKSILANTLTGLIWFLHRSHLYAVLVYTSKEASSFRAEKFQVLSENSAVTNSLLFHGLGNPVAHNVHGSQDHRALISHLLLLLCICHSQPTPCESLPPFGARSNLRSSV